MAAHGSGSLIGCSRLGSCTSPPSLSQSLSWGIAWRNAERLRVFRSEGGSLSNDASGLLPTTSASPEPDGLLVTRCAISLSVTQAVSSSGRASYGRLRRGRDHKAPFAQAP